MVVLAALVGLVCGSFANVLVARVPRDEQWVMGPSKCMRCAHPIAWYDNIPLLSWLVLRGRCRHCHATIGWRYPAVELVTCVLFALVVWRFGLSALSVMLVILAVITVALSAIDFAHQRLPHVLTYPSYVIGAVGVAINCGVESNWWPLARAGVGMVALGGFYLVMRVASRGGMGRGDVITAGFLGIVLAAVGWKALAVGAISALLIGGIVGVLVMVRTRRLRGVRVPFGPWLIAGAWVGILAGEPVGSWYIDVTTMSLSS